jgi:hypothetical protein
LVGIPNVFLTNFSAILLNSSRFSRHILAASTFAPLSSFGSRNKDIIINNDTWKKTDSAYY